MKTELMRERIEDGADLRVFGDLGLLGRADDADNDEGAVGRAFGGALENTAAECALAWPVTSREVVVDYGEAGGRIGVARGQEAAFAGRDAEGLKVVAGDAVRVDVLRRAARRGRRV